MINYNREIYRMYEEEVNKNNKLVEDNRYLRLVIHSLNKDLEIEKNKINKAIDAAIKPYVAEINKLNINLTNALNEIDRLKVIMIIMMMKKII